MPLRRVVVPRRRFGRRLTAAAVALVVGVAGIGSSPAAAAKSDAFCAAYRKIQDDPTNNKAIRKQATRMAKAKPPREVVKALAVIRAAASGDVAPSAKRVTNATSTLASYVSEQCSASGGSTSSGGSAGSAGTCPLTEEQVSSAVGATLVGQGACTFFPADDAWPNVIFVRQLSFACDGDFPAEVGYTEELDGLGVKAYVQPATAGGAAILVCTDRPFEVTVDMPGDGAAALAAARQLASEVLGRS